MGHQFYALLSGAQIEAFRTELAQDDPHPGRAVDAGLKAVFWRTVKIVEAGDMTRIVDAIAGAVRSAADFVAGTVLPLAAQVRVLDTLRRACIYRAEATDIASAIMSNARVLRGAFASGASDALRAVIDAAARYSANQIARPEAVNRLPRDGFLGVDALASDIAGRLAARAGKAIARQLNTPPDGAGKRTWRVPRSRTPRRTQQETGDLDVG